jgi:hypothetical protein
MMDLDDAPAEPLELLDQLAGRPQVERGVIDEEGVSLEALGQDEGISEEMRLRSLISSPTSSPAERAGDPVRSW